MDATAFIDGKHAVGVVLSDDVFAKENPSRRIFNAWIVSIMSRVSVLELIDSVAQGIKLFGILCAMRVKHGIA